MIRELVHPTVLERLEPPTHCFNEIHADILRHDENYKTCNASRAHLNQSCIDSDIQSDFDQVLKLLNDKKVEYLLVHPPVQNGYVEYFSSTAPKEKKQFDILIQYINSLKQNKRLFLWLTPDNIGMTDDLFLTTAITQNKARINFLNILSIR